MTKKAKRSTSSSTTKRRSDSQVPTTRGGTNSRRRGKKSNKRTGRTGGSSRRGSGSSRRAPRLPDFKLPRFSKPNFSFSFNFNARRKAITVGMIIIIAMLLALLSLLSVNRGTITGAILDFIWYLFGWGAPVMIIALSFLGLLLVFWGIERPLSLPPLRTIGAILLFVVIESFATLIAVMQTESLVAFDFDGVLARSGGGGLLGYFISQTLMEIVGMLGSVFTLTVLGLVGAMAVSGIRWEDIVVFWEQRIAREPAFAPQPQQRVGPAPVELPLGYQSAEDAADDEAIEDDDGSAADEGDPATAPPADEKKRRKRRSRARGNKKTTPAAPDTAPLREPAAPEPVFMGNASEEVNTWQLPTLPEMLVLGSEQSTDDSYIHQQAIIIEETLQSFGAPGQVVDINHGPTIIQYCVEPKYLVQRSGKRTKVKVGKIASLADDLALALAARSVRVQAPVPGKGYVGIEVPNESKALVSSRDVMEAPGHKKIFKKSQLALGLGEDVSGHPVSVDLTKMPHMLIAGATGSGKSVCINAVIACLLLQNTPEDLKMVMVDPKRVELTGYNGIPHLAAPVVVDMERVVGTLQWALREMDSRYKLFAEIGSRNITEYNKAAKRQKRKKLPYIVVIVDELADLMMLAPDDTERSIARLAQMARATGIHLILATQRPSVDVVTGLIKANFPSRIAFAVASSTDSRVVLDSTGAERLLGQGDMLFQSPDAPAPVRLQGCFVSDSELNKIIEFWKQEQRRAIAQMRDQRGTNVITAATDAVPKVELDSDVWDADSPEEKREKAAAIARLRREKAAERARKADFPKSAIPDTEPQASPVLTETPPSAPAPVAKKKETQPPLWEEMRDKLKEEQEKAISERTTHQDELWDEAVALVRELDKASTSLLQRRFRIGYTRAARLIDRMEDEGIIGPPTGTSKARDVLPVAEA